MEGTGMNWRKTTYSSGGANNCVEVANVPGRVLVRDTKQEGSADRTVIQVGSDAWERFANALK